MPVGEHHVDRAIAVVAGWSHSFEIDRGSCQRGKRNVARLHPADARVGPLDEQPLRSAGEWGRLPAGTPQQSLDGLFPRIETETEKP